MKRKLLSIVLILLVSWGIAWGSSETTNLKLTKPAKGDRDWGQTVNDNMDVIDSEIATIRSKSDDLPEVFVYSGTFNSTTGYQISLPKSVDSINEYAVKVTATSRAGAIGDIYVTKTTSDFTVFCAEANTTDTFSASIYYIGDVSAYGSSVYRKWYVSPDTGITDHADTSQARSLAWIQSEIGGIQATVELTGNKNYQLKQNLTIVDTIQLAFQKGAVIDTDFSIRDSNYEWTASGSGTSEYYLQASGGGDPGVNQPAVVIESGAQMTEGNAGTLAAGEWDWNDNDSLGYATVYVRLSDGADPDAKSADYVEAGYLLTLPEPPNDVGLRQIIGGHGNVSFSHPGTTRPEWWYSGSGSYDFALEQAVISQCRTYADSDGVSQCGEVLLTQVYEIDDTFTITRPVRIRGNFIEASTGPTRGPRSGARIISTISSASKDIIEMVGTSIDGSPTLMNTAIEDVGIIGSGSERDAIRISAAGYINGIYFRNIHVHGPGANGLTVTSDNDGFYYSTIDNFTVYNAGQDSFSFESGNSDTVGNQLINCRSGSATRYGLYLAVSGFKVDNFIDDSSGTSGIRLVSIRGSQFQNCTTETGSNEGWYLSGAYGNTFVNCTGTNNTGDQFYLTGGSYNNLFIACALNKIGSEKHITYATSSDKNNIWLAPRFHEVKDVADSAKQNIYLFERDLTDGTPLQYITTGGATDVIYYDSIFGTFRETFVTKTADYTVTAKDKYIWVNASSGAVNITLAPADNILRGQEFVIKKTDSSANAVTVTGSIDGGNVILAAQYGYVRVVCDGGSGLYHNVGN